jgi:hypothetical protein
MTYFDNDYKDIFVYRKGYTDDSFMITNQLIDVITQNNQLLLFKDNQLIRVINDDIPLSINHKKDYKIPNNIFVPGYFVNSNINNNNNNILGYNDYFISKMEHIVIPESPIEQKYLNFYGATLIKPNMLFQMENNQAMPIFKMTIGQDYVENYLLKEEFGNGFYIETHDTPHFHQPLNIHSSGYIILGKKENGGFHLTKFNIPYDYALYTHPNTYHCDAFLIGEYNVMYTKTNNYSTYLFRTENNKIILVS